MDWTIQDLGALGEFVSSLAVLVTLIYLARQIGENNKLARSSSAHNAMMAFGLVNELIVTNPVFADLMARLKSPGVEFTPTESV